MLFEEVLEELGGFGKYQKSLLWLYLLPASVFFPFFMMNLIFLLSAPDHTCVVPQLDALNLNGSRLAELRTLLVTEDECFVRPTRLLNSTNWITLQDHSLNESSLLDASLQKEEPCQEFVYDQTYYHSTVATQWNLVCSRGHLPSLVYTLTTVGSVIGTTLFGVMSDRLGRRITFFAIVGLAIGTGYGAVVVNSFALFAAMRFINALLDVQIEQLPYIILLELVGPNQRTLMLGVSCMGWTVGMCLLPLVAYLSRSWITLAIATSSCAVPLLFYWKLLPESPRWLLSQGRLQEASSILRKVALRNGVQPPPDLDAKLKKVQLKISADEESEQSGSALDLISKPNIRRNILILTLVWVGNSCAYYGLHINVSNLAGNEFLNFFYLGLVEIPANLAGWWSMEYFGRRWTNVFFLLLTAASCAMPVIAPESGTVGVVSSMIAKFATAAAFMMMYQLSAELMPTPLRSLSLGVLASLSSTITIAMPYVVYLSKYGNWIPFLFLSVILTIAGVLSAWLPETKGVPLCQTIEDACNLGKGQKFFSFNRIEETKELAQRENANGEKVAVELEPLSPEVPV